jgi:hypothetical protein
MQAFLEGTCLFPFLKQLNIYKQSSVDCRLTGVMLIENSAERHALIFFSLPHISLPSVSFLHHIIILPAFSFLTA